MMVAAAAGCLCLPLADATYGSLGLFPRELWSRPTFDGGDSTYPSGGGGSTVASEFFLVFVARRRHLPSDGSNGMVGALSFRWDWS